MKIRVDFVTNSSSSSFTIHKKTLSEKQIQAIWNHSALGEKLNLDYFDDSWKISETDEFITGETYMDNFDMKELFDIIGIRPTQVMWGRWGSEYPENDEDLTADAKYLSRKKCWDEWEAVLDEKKETMEVKNENQDGFCNKLKFQFVFDS